MENCDIMIKEEQICEDDCFFTIRELSEDEELLEEPITAPVIITVPDEKQSVKCKICNKGFLPQDLAIHSATAHITSTRCERCKTSFPSNWYLSRHESICSSNQQQDTEANMECKGCGKKLTSIWELKLHSVACKYKPSKKVIKKKKSPEEKKKKKKYFICQVCHLVFTHRILLAQHSVSHALKTTTSNDSSFDDTLLNVVRRK